MQQSLAHLTHLLNQAQNALIKSRHTLGCAPCSLRSISLNPGHHFISQQCYSRRVLSTWQQNQPRVDVSDLRATCPYRPGRSLNTATPLEYPRSSHTRLYATSSDASKAPISKKIKFRKTKREVPVGGNGSVELAIYSLDGTSKSTDGVEVEEKAANSSPNRHVEDVVIYLPNGSLNLLSSDEDTDFQRLLAALANRDTNVTDSAAQTVFKINYRLLPGGDPDDPKGDLRFPTAIHDVAKGFDWILEYVGQESLDDVRIILCGSEVGGAMALTLALTNPNLIHAVAARNPIVDWTGLDELALVPPPPASEIVNEELEAGTMELDALTQKRRRPKMTSRRRTQEVLLSAQSQAAKALISMRTRLFRTPSGFFDAFSSPLLFLRAPGRDTPPWKTARPEPLPELQQNFGLTFGPYDDDWHPLYHSGLQESNVKKKKDDQNANIIAEAAGADALYRAANDTDDAKVEEDFGSSPKSQVETDLSGNPADAFLSGTSPRSLHGLADATSSSLQTASSHVGSRVCVRSPPSMASSQSTSPSHGPDTPNHDDNPAFQLVKRRKVLRRWPPVGRPEDVLLPHVRIISTLPQLSTAQMPSEQPGNDDTKLPKEDKDKFSPVDFAAVLNAQAKEMVDVMQRSCFWGREPGLAMERVTLEETERNDTHDGSDIMEMVNWLMDEKDPNGRK